MREKTMRFVVTFYTTAEAMAMERLCRAKGIEGKLISAPRSVSADCGIAWAAPPEERERIEKEPGLPEIAGVYLREL